MDKFKSLNDTHGHNAGDLLLIEVARRISSCVREIDVVARLGGDEFAVMFNELGNNAPDSTTQATVVAEKIRVILGQPYMLKMEPDGKAGATVEHHCSSSIGVALFLDHEVGPEEVIKWADIAMYDAKKAGGNLIRFSDS